LQDKELLQYGYRYAWTLTKNKHDAEDLVHESWLKLYSKYGPFKNKYLFYRTIHNHFIDQFRKGKPFTFEQIEDYHATSNPFDDMDINTTKEELKLAMDTLRPEERQAIYLNYYEGYSASKIAKINDMPRSTVLSMLQRGKQKLAKSLRSLSDIEKREIKIEKEKI